MAPKLTPSQLKNASRFAKTTFAKVSPFATTDNEDYIEYHYDDVGTAPGTLSIDADALPSELVLIEYSPDPTILIPLSFVVGLYGMNFNTEVSPWNMPELQWTYGYPLCLLAMGAIAGGLIVFFWRKGWFEDFS